MGYYSQNIITTFENESDEDLISELKKYFSLAKVKKFHSDFHGVVAQVERGELMRKCDPEKMRELEEEIALLDERAIEFSKLYPEKTFVYIDVDCFGGTCSYDGFTVKNGNTLFTQKPVQDGHITLLKSIFPKYENVYFEPFTRDFFVRKGRIEGVIQDFTLGGLFVGFNSEYKDKSLYKISASSDFLLFERLEDYYFLFESDEQSDDIKISGIIYKDEKEVLQEIEELIQETFFILTYTIFISIDGALEPKRFENKVESPKQKRKSIWQRLID